MRCSYGMIYEDLKLFITHYHGSKISLLCPRCNTERTRRLDEMLSEKCSTALCQKCACLTRVGVLISAALAANKRRTKTWNCINCKTVTTRNRKYCDACHCARMTGDSNPSWTGKHSGCPDCGAKKSFGAARCRPCSFRGGHRSGNKNGRWVEHDREVWLFHKRIRSWISAYVCNYCHTADIKKSHQKSVEILGYSSAEFIAAIEPKLLPGMSWSNHGKYGWHIDHVIPVSWFVRCGILNPMIVNALWNLQPMWATENCVKNDKLTPAAIDLICSKNLLNLNLKTISIVTSLDFAECTPGAIE